MTLLNPDFELNTFYWFYAKSDSSGPQTVLTYTAVFFDTSKDHHTDAQRETSTPFLIIECKALTQETTWIQPEQDEYTVDTRVIEAIKKHFSTSFMTRDGMILTAEYCADADRTDCALHFEAEYGRAIFGSDLEELYDNQ